MNLAWAFAKLDFQTEELIESIAAAALALSTQYNAQELGITPWACARLLVGHPPLLEALSSAAIARITELAPQNLSNMAWA